MKTQQPISYQQLANNNRLDELQSFIDLLSIIVIRDEMKVDSMCRLYERSVGNLLIRIRHSNKLTVLCKYHYWITYYAFMNVIYYAAEMGGEQIG